MTKEQCKEKVLELKESLDKDFEKQLDDILSVGGQEMENAEDNYRFPRAVLAALLIHQAKSIDGWGAGPNRNVIIRTSKNGALMCQRY